MRHSDTHTRASRALDQIRSDLADLATDRDQWRSRCEQAWAERDSARAERDSARATGFTARMAP